MEGVTAVNAGLTQLSQTYTRNQKGIRKGKKRGRFPLIRA
jgi:hypothetical protein